MSPCPRPTTRLCVVMAALTLAGCAAPILKLGGAGYSPADSPALAHEPQTMAEALQKLNHVHAAYYEAIRSQQETNQNATTGLTWLGAVMIGLAAGNAHRDAIMGGALIGGTTYGLTRTQLDARRIDVWQEGLEALDCAREASLPLDFGDERRQAIAAARTRLHGSSSVVSTAIDNLRQQLNAVASSKLEQAPQAEEAVTQATLALADAEKAQDAAAQLLDASRGRELSTTVDRIHAKVTRATNSLSVDVSAVKQTLSGIGGFAAMFVPGIDSTLGGVFDKYKVAKADAAAAAAKKGGEQAAPDDTALRQAMDRLNAAMQTLAADQAALKDLLLNFDATAISTALKQCNITFVASALTLQPATLNFDAKTVASKGFAISGGTPPYEVSLLDSVADNNVSIAFSGALADTAQVKVTANAANGSYSVLVKDSSTSHHVQTLIVQVGPKTPAAAPPAGAASAPTAKPKVEATGNPGAKPAPKPTTPVKGSTTTTANPPGAASGAASSPQKAASEPDKTASAPVKADPAATAAWGQLATALLDPKFSVQTQGVTLSVVSAKVQGPGLRVVVRCDQPTTAIPIDRLRALLATANITATTRLRQLGAMDAAATQIDASPSATCQKS